MNKLLVILSVFCLCFSSISAQIKVGTNNNVVIGTTSGDPLSKFSVGDLGASNLYFNINSPLTANYSRGLYVYQCNTPTYRYAIQGSTPSIGGYAYAVYGYAYNATVGTSGRSYGVYGYAGNATSGYNYGVYGYLAGSNNGAGVFGTISGDASVDGKYAGYFYGNLKITGNGYVNGSVLITSDINAKKDITFLSNGNIAKIDKLKGIKYKLKTPEELQNNNLSGDTLKTRSARTIEENKIFTKERIGLSAQDVQKVFPELVETDNSGMLSVDYIGLIPVLIEALKEQQAEIEALKVQITKISGK